MRTNHDFITARISDEYPRYCDYYTEMFIRLIGYYRNTNLEEREDDGPAYFSEEIELEWDIESREEQLEEIDKKITYISNRLINLQDTWEESRKSLEKKKLSFIEILRHEHGIS